MSIRNWVLTAGAVAIAAGAGVATSQQPAPPPNAATLIALTPSRTEAAALAQARQDPLTARLRGGLGRDNALAGLLERIDASAVPVLGPPAPALLSTAEFNQVDRAYMLVVRDGERTVEIYGSVKAFQAPTAPPRPVVATAPRAGVATTRAAAPVTRALAQARARGLTNIRTEHTDYGVEVAFNRFGAAYNVTVMCEGAPDCSEAEAVAFAASLQLIGGGA